MDGTGTSALNSENKGLIKTLLPTAIPPIPANMIRKSGVKKPIAMPMW